MLTSIFCGSPLNGSELIIPWRSPVRSTKSKDFPKIRVGNSLFYVFFKAKLKTFETAPGCLFKPIHQNSFLIGPLHSKGFPFSAALIRLNSSKTSAFKLRCPFLKFNGSKLGPVTLFNVRSLCFSLSWLFIQKDSFMDPSHVDWLKLLIGSFFGAAYRAGIALNTHWLV